MPTRDPAPTIAVAVHDGFYGTGTGAGYANRAFLRILARELAQETRLIVLPVRLTPESTEYDQQWHTDTRTLLATHDTEIIPVDNGTDGRTRFAGLTAFELLATTTADALNARLDGRGHLLIMLFDVPFLGVPQRLRLDLATQLVVVPRSTAILHDPNNLDRVRFEQRGFAATVDNAGKVATISRFMRGHLRRHYDVPAESMIELNDGLTTADRQFSPPDTEALPPPAEHGFILALGRAQPYKGWDDLINALHLVSNINPPHAILAAVNDDASPSVYQRHLASRITTLGLNATLLTRFSPRIRNLLAHPMIRMVVVPSRREPFGRIPLEAYAAGVAPLVTTTAGGLAEQIIDGITGFAAEPEHPVSPASAMRRALALTPAQTKQMRAASQRLLTSRFDHNLATCTFLNSVAPWCQASGRAATRRGHPASS